MAITVSTLRITPYTQKDALKPIFGDRLTFDVDLPTPHMEGDRYALGCDYERVVFPPARPLCAYTEEFSVAGGTVTMTLLFATARFRDWVSTLKKPMPIYLQMVRLRGDTQETLLLDDILALPSVVDGQNIVCEGDPLQELLDEKQDRPEEDGTEGQVLGLDADGNPVWVNNGGVYVQADWDESDSGAADYIRNKPALDYIPTSEKGAAGGVAELGSDGKVPSEQLPPMTGDYIPTSEKGAANGVATLDEDALVPVGQLPVAGNDPDHMGVVYTSQAFGVTQASGRLQTVAAPPATIDGKANRVLCIAPFVLDYAVRSVLPNVTEIPAATTAYNLLDASATTNDHSWQYVHAPTSAPTYTLPDVTDTTTAHQIVLIVDFTSVQTYSFVDANGDAITPLFTPSISAGDVYEFRCEYSTVQSRWLIYPCKQGAVSDDFVMRGEVGAANGVAGLDANAKVPRAQLPKAGGGSNDLGAVAVHGSYGVGFVGNLLSINRSSEASINGRANNYLPIVPSNLNYAVTAALTDANKIQLTDAQKEAACDSLGAALRPIVASGAPTTATVGAVGQLYVDTAGGAAYICTSSEGESYTWAQITAA